PQGYRCPQATSLQPPRVRPPARRLEGQRFGRLLRGRGGWPPTFTLSGGALLPARAGDAAGDPADPVVAALVRAPAAAAAPGVARQRVSSGSSPRCWSRARISLKRGSRSLSIVVTGAATNIEEYTPRMRPM